MLHVIFCMWCSKLRCSDTTRWHIRWYSAAWDNTTQTLMLKHMRHTTLQHTVGGKYCNTWAQDAPCSWGPNWAHLASTAHQHCIGKSSILSNAKSGRVFPKRKTVFVQWLQYCFHLLSQERHVSRYFQIVAAKRKTIRTDRHGARYFQPGGQEAFSPNFFQK